MNYFLIDILTALTLFVLGIVFTVFRFVKRGRAVYATVALLAPVVAAVSLFRMLYLQCSGRISLEPCPVGLEEAEMEVAIHRRELFGGPLRKPMFAPAWAQAYASAWAKAYERELQRELERVQNYAEKHFARV